MLWDVFKTVHLAHQVDDDRLQNMKALLWKLKEYIVFVRVLTCAQHNWKKIITQRKQMFIQKMFPTCYWVTFQQILYKFAYM